MGGLFLINCINITPS